MAAPKMEHTYTSRNLRFFFWGLHRSSMVMLYANPVRRRVSLNFGDTHSKRVGNAIQCTANTPKRAHGGATLRRVILLDSASRDYARVLAQADVVLGPALAHVVHLTNRIWISAAADHHIPHT